MLDPRTVGVRGALNRFNRRRLHAGGETLADRVFAPALLMDLVLILCGAALVAVSAQFVVPMWPVPSTGQIIGVLLVGYCLGAVRAGLALVLYVTVGSLGVPVFSLGAAGNAHLQGETGGYLVGFVVMAVLAGLCAAQGWDRALPSILACSFIVTLVMYALGVARLMVVRDVNLAAGVQEGFLPLIAGGAAKAIAASILVAAAWQMDARRTPGAVSPVSPRKPAPRKASPGKDSPGPGRAPSQLSASREAKV